MRYCRCPDIQETEESSAEDEKNRSRAGASGRQGRVQVEKTLLKFGPNLLSAPPKLQTMRSRPRIRSPLSR